MERWTVVSDKQQPVAYVLDETENPIDPARMIVFECRFDAYKWIVKHGCKTDEVVKIKFEVIR